MILYHGSTAYHILYSIVHKLYYHYEDKAVLMITEYMKPKEELSIFVERIKECNWFERIEIVPEASFGKITGKKLNEKSTASEINDVVNKMCELVENWYPQGFSQFDEIYLAADQWSVGTYLLKNHIPYYYMEDASGMLGEEERYLKLLRDTNLHNYIICQYMRGAGRSSIVVKKLCDMDNQPDGFFDEKAVDYSIYKTLTNLDSGRRKEVIRLYEGEILPLASKKKTMLFLAQYYKNLEIRSISMQKKMTYLLLDYFGNEYDLIVKPHPKDCYIPYEAMFPECRVIKRSVPSELLPFMINGTLDLVLTPNSTSIGGLRYSCKQMMSFGSEIEVYYERLHIYYVAACVIKTIGRDCNVFGFCVNQQFLDNFYILLGMGQQEKKQMGSAIFIDGGKNLTLPDETTAESSFTSEDTILFLEFENRYTFLTYPWIEKENLLEICINISEPDYPVRKKSIWLYTKDKAVRKEVEQMEETKNLKASGITLHASAREVTENQILKGKIKALEYALKKREHEASDKLLEQAGLVIEQYKTEKHITESLMENDGMLP